MAFRSPRASLLLSLRALACILLTACPSQPSPDVEKSGSEFSTPWKQVQAGPKEILVAFHESACFPFAAFDTLAQGDSLILSVLVTERELPNLTTCPGPPQLTFKSYVLPEGVDASDVMPGEVSEAFRYLESSLEGVEAPDPTDTAPTPREQPPRSN